MSENITKQEPTYCVYEQKVPGLFETVRKDIPLEELEAMALLVSSNDAYLSNDTLQKKRSWVVNHFHVLCYNGIWASFDDHFASYCNRYYMEKEREKKKAQ